MFTYNFIEKIGRVNTDISRYYFLKYLTHFDEYENETECKKCLENEMRVFRHEIQSLPFKLSTKQSRTVFLNNIYDEFILTKETLHLQFTNAITESHECIYIKNNSLKYFIPRFLQKKYLTKVKLAYQKLHEIYSLQNDIIERAIVILQTSALNDGVKLKVIEAEPIERFKTNLSSSELSYLFYSILKTVSAEDKFSRSNLSNIIANHFSTKKAISPQANQIKKHFTDVNDTVKNSIKNLFSELSHSV